MDKIFKVHCEYYVKAKNKDEVKEFVQEELAFKDYYESHIIIEEEQCASEKGLIPDYDLTKGK